MVSFEDSSHGGKDAKWQHYKCSVDGCCPTGRDLRGGGHINEVVPATKGLQVQNMADCLL